MNRFLNSDAWAHGLPCALVIGLIVAVIMGGGCANNGLGGKTLEEFWASKDRAHHALPARRP